MMFWGYIFQTVILNLGYALSPLLIGFMAIPALKQAGNRYLLNLVGVLFWPLGWAVAALVTQGILDFMSDPSFEYLDPTSTLPDLQKTIGAAAVGFWIIFSTIAAPIIIQQVISSRRAGGQRVAFRTAHTLPSKPRRRPVGGAVAAAPLRPASPPPLPAEWRGLLSTMFSTAGRRCQRRFACDRTRRARFCQK